MINFLICLIISVFLSNGISILIVNKGNEFPIRVWRIRLQLLLRKIHWKLPRMLFCETCSSFWMTLPADIIMCIVAYLHGFFYFFFPFSGFICAGIVWIIMEYINSVDNEPNINVFIDNKGEENEK